MLLQDAFFFFPFCLSLHLLPPLHIAVVEVESFMVELLLDICVPLDLLDDDGLFLVLAFDSVSKVAGLLSLLLKRLLGSLPLASIGLLDFLPLVLLFNFKPLHRFELFRNLLAQINCLLLLLAHCRKVVLFVDLGDSVANVLGSQGLLPQL